ncbi:hypothetical protein [Clostridium botulinum]|uniref:hypothetical protein n=1 Tax=Clostridium botulinum TaxID=1491 RepID=UPI00016B9667|nr:hypothetical protein [Clostridium botulinum]EDT87241.1 hypothetical protein CBB_0573 [Clostridium botulinum Bf]MBY6797053.1 hypothetical protein [Clostridium botulinum]MBY6866524.1 hypothetical protein [Clostridium botulinum]MBY6873023.1 hypothetical protein [Clostridium botulinum]MBY6881871.1 hypothetical protein [Clostridium botulinum]
MKKYIKYKGIKITLVYCDYKNFNWYATKKCKHIILFINNHSKNKSKVLHKVIKSSYR